MNDTVREELESKLGKIPSGPLSPKPTRMEFVEPPKPPTVAAPAPKPALPEQPVRPKTVTAELNKRDTSPTLVGFQPKNPSIPDWRLELQNSIRRRNGGTAATVEPAAPQMTSPVSAVAVQNSPAVVPASVPTMKSERVANALRRIEESRRTFATAATAPATVSPPRKAAVPARSFPFNVVERTKTDSKSAVAAPALKPTPKPQLVSSLRIEKKKFDTNKLPPIPEPNIELPIELAPEQETVVRNEAHFERLSIKNEIVIIDEVDAAETEFEEIDDLAPLSMRFGAAVFDLIIGGFAAAILLSPFFIANANLASLSGFLAITGAVIVVMFVYQTATMAFLGRTFGMKLFSIEIIDAEANELPTLHQSAVNSAVYLLSLLLGGIGFLPAFFNEERRTLHDMLSGTILIREY